MRMRTSKLPEVMACAGLLMLFAAPVWGQVFHYELPVPLPFYGGDTMADYVLLSGGDVTDLTLLMPGYLYRPLDDLTCRPGAAALGMGGAHVAAAEGAFAMGWNPAGMASLRETEFAVDGFAVSSGGSATLLPDTILVEGFPEFQITNYEDRLRGRQSFGFLGAAIPLLNIGSRPLVAGIAHRRHTEVAYGEEILIELELLEGTGFPLIVANSNDERGSIESFTLGLAYEALRAESFSLSLGGTANFLQGRLRADDELSVQARGAAYGAETFQRDYSGFTLELGAKADVADLVKLGAWVGLPHTLEVSNSRFRVRPLIATVSDIVYYVSGEVAPYDLELPLFASGGVVVGPIKGVTLAADVNHRPWSEAEIKHHLQDYAVFDGPYPAADVTSYHVGGTFEFPFFREPLHGLGMELYTQVGCRSLPLAMYELDLLYSSQPYFLGDQVEGTATSFGFTLKTSANVDFHLGMEFQSYAFRKWFGNDSRPLDARELGFEDPWDRAPHVDRSVTILRFSSQMHL